MRRTMIATALVLAVGAITSSATTIEDEPGLYAACTPMELVVENLSPEGARETGLTKKTIVNAVESRLRGARLFAPLDKLEVGREQYLYVNVNVVGPAFSVRVELKRNIGDLGYGLPGVAVVWDTGATGTQGGNGQYILSVVSEYLDEFLASYLRVNEAACSR